MEKQDNSRLLALEGLRGLAAVAVVLFHVLQNYFPRIINGPGIGNTQHFFLDDNLYGLPFMAFLSGPFAVAIFFVLSGFVLSVGFFNSGESSVKKLATKRYLRLMIPAACSVMIAWVLVHFSYIGEANKVIQNSGLTYVWVFDHNFWSALYEGTIGVFIGNPSNYNPVTWTMVFEFAGSLVVFAFCLLFGNLKRRWIMYIVLLLITIQTWFLPFILGMILSDLYVNRRQVFSNSPLGFFMLAIGIFFGSYPVGDISGTIYRTLTIDGWSDMQSRDLFFSLGAFMIIAAVLSISTLRRFLSSKIVSGLGKYTFSLYLVHLPLLYTVSFGMFVYLVNVAHLGYIISVIIATLVHFIATAVATWLFERYIDAPAIRLSSKFATLVLMNDYKTTTK